MIKAIFKTLGWAVGLIAIPLLLVVVGIALSVVGPVAGIAIIIFLPLIVVGVVIGYREAKKDNKDWAA